MRTNILVACKNLLNIAQEVNQRSAIEQLYGLSSSEAKNLCKQLGTSEVLLFFFTFIIIIYIYFS